MADFWAEITLYAKQITRVPSRPIFINIAALSITNNPQTMGLRNIEERKNN